MKAKRYTVTLYYDYAGPDHDAFVVQGDNLRAIADKTPAAVAAFMQRHNSYNYDSAVTFDTNLIQSLYDAARDLFSRPSLCRAIDSGDPRWPVASTGPLRHFSYQIQIFRHQPGSTELQA